MRFSLSLISLSLATISLSATAQAASVRPDAGQSLRSIEQAPLQLPDRQTIELNLPDTPSTEMVAGGPSLQVSSFQLMGNETINSDELLSLLTDLQGRVVSLSELQAGVNRITRLYRERGYPLARAYIPAQEVEAGVMQIAILEGRYGAVKINNQSRNRDSALAPLAALQDGDTVRAQSLEHSLLLLQDTPGVQVSSTLQPGTTVGTTDLLVDVQSAPLVSGSVDLSNYGNRFTGEYRLGGTLNLNSPLGLGDQLSLQALGSNEEQHYYRAAYQLPIGRWGTQVGVAYSDLDYQLAKDFTSLDAHGNARITSAYVIQPLIRSRDFSLYTQLQFDDKRLKDDIDLFADKSDKRSRVVTASLYGTSVDNFFGGGINSFALGWSQGSLNIDGSLKQLLDDLSAGTRGSFYKINPSLVRLQRLSNRFSLYLQAQGQWANGNLDSSEKISLGGAHGVRAYPEGEASGDQGWLGKVELRYALTPAWQLATFVDHGQVRLNKNTWSNGDNHRSLSGAGFGVTWAEHGWHINAVAAWKLGNADAQSDVERSPRMWAQVVRYF